MNSNTETEFLPTDYDTWVAPIRSVGSITAVFNYDSIRAMDSLALVAKGRDCVMAGL